MLKEIVSANLKKHLQKINVRFNKKSNKKKPSFSACFTLVEILTALAVVGIVSAITIPSIIAHLNEKVWSSQRRTLHARLSQGLAILPKLNGYGNSSDYDGTATEYFVKKGLAKVYKVNGTCTQEEDGDEFLSKCGFSDKYITADGLYENSYPKVLNDLDLGSSPSLENTNAVAFISMNGESILVLYNPDCKEANPNAQSDYAQEMVCANFIYDLNNTKGPNQVGKDIGFITAMYATEPVVVAPLPYKQDLSNAYSFDKAPSACKETNSMLRVPDINELGAIWYNKELLNLDGMERWSSSLYSSAHGWSQTDSGKRVHDISRDVSNTIRCIWK